MPYVLYMGFTKFLNKIMMKSIFLLALITLIVVFLKQNSNPSGLHAEGIGQSSDIKKEKEIGYSSDLNQENLNRFQKNKRKKGKKKKRKKSPKSHKNKNHDKK